MVSDAQLFALINKVNPTGRGLPETKERARYLLKARLQGVLVHQLGDRLSVAAEPELAPGVVSLRHRHLDCGATHAVLAELEPDARARVQLILDTEHDAAEPLEHGAGTSQPAPQAAAVSGPASGTDPDPADAGSLLARGRSALEAYDYHEARSLLTAAVDKAKDDTEPAVALLELLVDHLAAYDGALGAARTLPARTVASPQVTELLALAAARSGQPALADQLIGRQRRGRAAEVRLLMADLALNAGELGRVQALVDEVRQNCAQQPLEALLDVELVRLEAALGAASAAEVEPLEREATAAFEQHDLDRAERLARQILERWDASGVARRVLRTVGEQRAQHKAEAELRAAEQALAAGDPRTAIAHFEAALVHGAPLAAVHPRQQEAQMRLRRAEEAALVAATVAKVQGAEAAAGLAEYLALNEGLRQQARGLCARPALAWLEELDAAAASKKTQRRACAAVLALERADQALHGDGDASDHASEMLDHLQEHAALLNRLAHGRRLFRHAQEQRSLQEQAEAENTLQLARAALARSDPDAAHAALAGLKTRALPPHLREQAQQIGSAVAALGEAHRITAQYDRRMAEKDLLGAREAARLMVQGATGEQRALWQKRHRDVSDQIQRVWGVRHVACEGEAAGAFFAGGWNSSETVHPLVDAEREVMYLVRAADHWVFVATVSWPGGDLRAAAAVRTPAPLGQVAQAQLCDRDLWVTGDRGTALVCSTDGLSVRAWHDFSQWTGAAVVESVTPVPGGRFVWIAASDRKTRICRALVLDRISGRVSREVDDVGHVQVVATPHKTVVFDGLLSDARLSSPAGAVLGRLDRAPYVPEAVAIADNSDTLVSIGRETDDDGDDDDDDYDRGFLQVRTIGPDGRLGEPSALDLAYVDGGRCLAASWDARLAFALVEAESPTGIMLWGFKVESSRVTPLYARSAPAESFLVRDETSSRVGLVYFDGDRAHIHDLSRGQQPVFEPLPGPGPGRYPTAVHGFLLCRSRLSEAEDAATVMSLARKVAMTHDSAAVAFVQSYCAAQGSDPEALLRLQCALRHPSVPPERRALLREQLRSVRERHPDAVHLQLHWAAELAEQQRWEEAAACLSRLDAARIADVAERHYYHHLLGRAQMAQGEAGRAYASFETARQLGTQDSCGLEEDIALVAPRDGDTLAGPHEHRAETPAAGHGSADDSARRAARRANAIETTLALRTTVQDAQAAREAGDWVRALRTLDRPAVWLADEAQTLARLAEAFLMLSDGAERGPLWGMRKATALAALCESRRTKDEPAGAQRGVVYPEGTLSEAQLTAIAAQARQWLMAWGATSDAA